jgi:hypothetical protein
MERETPESEANQESIEDYLDEVLKESFPASDPPSSWPGGDLRDVRTDPSPEESGEIPDPVPEADDPGTNRARNETDGMEGPAPTG